MLKLCTYYSLFTKHLLCRVALEYFDIVLKLTVIQLRERDMSCVFPRQSNHSPSASSLSLFEMWCYFKVCGTTNNGTAVKMYYSTTCTKMNWSRILVCTLVSAHSLASVNIWNLINVQFHWFHLLSHMSPEHITVTCLYMWCHSNFKIDHHLRII